MTNFDNEEFRASQVSFYVTVDREVLDVIRVTDPFLAMALKVAIGMLARFSPADIRHVYAVGGRVGKNAAGTPLEMYFYMVRWNFADESSPAMELVPHKEEKERRGLLVRFRESATAPSGWEYRSHEFTNVVMQ